LALERPERAPSAGRSNLVALAGENHALERALTAAGFLVRRVPLTPYDAAAAARVEHFDTYNRTAASLRVADIAGFVAANPGASLVADGELGPAALLALAAAPAGRAVIDIGQFDNGDDRAFVDRLYIPGLRRAGDFQTAIGMATGSIVVHDGGGRFTVPGAPVEPRKLTPAEVVAALKSAAQ